MKTFNLLLLSLLLYWACGPSAMATPRVAFAWTEVSFTTEGGTHLEASCDKRNRLTRLVVTKNGRTFSLPEAAMKDMVDVGLHEIQVFEEKRFDSLLIKIRAMEFDDETGSPIKEIMWLIEVKNGELVSVTHQDKAISFF